MSCSNPGCRPGWSPGPACRPCGCSSSATRWSALTNAEDGPAYTREQIGRIQVTEFCTFVAVARDVAKAACAKLNAGKVKGKSVRVRILTVSDNA